MANKGIPYDAVKNPRVTNESCWNDDNLLPNPPHNLKHPDDVVFADKVAENVHDTKVIMAHEFRENPEGFKSMAQTVADSYNDQHKLRVGEKLPIGLKEDE